MDELVQFWVRAALIAAIALVVVCMTGCGSVSISHSPAEISVGGQSAPTTGKTETPADKKPEGS